MEVNRDPPLQPLRCEALTRRGRRCRNKPVGRFNALDLCQVHYDKCKQEFEKAEQRWKDAGEPESDL
jgi:hypothetical protein